MSIITYDASPIKYATQTPAPLVCACSRAGGSRRGLRRVEVRAADASRASARAWQLRALSEHN